MYFDPLRAIYIVRSDKGLFSQNRTRAEACADLQTIVDDGGRGKVYCLGSYGEELVCPNCGQPSSGKSFCVCHKEYPET